MEKPKDKEMVYKIELEFGSSLRLGKIVTPCNARPEIVPVIKLAK